MHGASYTNLYKRWIRIRERCLNPNAPNFDNYGGRGITVCDEWLNSFIPFRDWALVNGYKPWLQIDRIDNDGDYTPENCRWISCKLNQRNKRNSRLITAYGETKTIVEWTEDERCQLDYHTIHVRLARRWSEDKAITTPKLR